jgi:hypothetical protein
MLSERFGWRLTEGNPPEPPVPSAIEVVGMLLKHEAVQPVPSKDEPRPRWLWVTINRIIIVTDRFSPQKIAWWTKPWNVSQSLSHEGARTSSLSEEPSRLPALQETKMPANHEKRFRAESQALRELSEEKPLSPEESRLLLERRRREFDEAWRINPESKTENRPIRLVK